MQFYHCMLYSTDIQVGFWAESLTVSESSGDVEIAVRVFPNENGNTPHIGKPFGLRITSKDESAVGRIIIDLKNL